MRCKRCGEQLEPMDTRCPVCGKAVAPRRKAPAQKPSETSIKLPQLDKFTHAYSEDAARSRVLQLATIAAVLVAVVLLVLVFAGVGDLKSAVSDLKVTADAQLQAMQNQQQTPAPTEGDAEPEPQTDPTEETTGEPANTQSLPLSQQALSAQLTLYRGGSGSYAAAYMDLGGYDDRAEAWVSTAREGSSRETRISWILEESGDRLDMTLSETYGGGNAAAISLSWAPSGDTFSGFGSPVCIWEYQVVGDSWESLPTEYLTPVGGGCELAISADQLEGLTAQYTEIQLRCLVSMSHPSGGTMHILVDGIRFDGAGLTVSGDLLD